MKKLALVLLGIIILQFAFSFAYDQKNSNQINYIADSKDGNQPNTSSSVQRSSNEDGKGDRPTPDSSSNQPNSKPETPGYSVSVTRSLNPSTSQQITSINVQNYEVNSTLDVQVVGDAKEPSRLMATLSNGNQQEVRVMPDTASRVAISRLQSHNVSVQLREVGNGNNLRAMYVASTSRSVRLFGIWRITLPIQMYINSEDGTIDRVDAPFWRFLTNDNLDYSQLTSNINLVDSNYCHVIRQNSDVNKAINIVFVPSNFSGDLAKFEEKAREYWTYFEAHAPFDPQIVELNAFFVTKEADIANDFCVRAPEIDTSNSNVLNSLGSTSRALFCRPYVAKRLSSYCIDGLHETIVIQNDENYGGNAMYAPVNYHIATTSFMTGDIVSMHELSHILFELRDEYVHPKVLRQGSFEREYPNCDIIGCPLWDDLIGRFPESGCYANHCAGGESYAEAENSIMSSGTEYSPNQKRIACCIYKIRTGSYPASLCNQFMNPELTNIDTFCEGIEESLNPAMLQSSAEIPSSGDDDVHQFGWEIPIDITITAG